MKRATLGVLIVSLVAFPLFAANGQKSPLEKLSAARCVSLEHVSGAWQMHIECDQGAGVISLTDGGGQMLYRGEGLFLGWSQQRLNAAYQSLIPRDDTPALQLVQLG
jgi:hypothetical protein